MKHIKHKHLIIWLFFGFILTAVAQQSISGTFSPAKEYTWLIAYYLKPGSQVYVADTSIKDGKFTLKMPADAKQGVYRLVYAVPQEEFYFDVIYDGKEAIELAFNQDKGVSFAKSKENLLFHNYTKQIGSLERQIIDFYKNGETDKATFSKLAKELKQAQNSNLKESENTIAHNFIVANNPYIPANWEPLEDYIAHKNKNYFLKLDFKNKVLQASNFLTEKAVNYALTSLPLEPISLEQTQREIQKNTTILASYLEGVSANYSTSLYYNLWLQLVRSGYHRASDYLYNRYLKSLATEAGQNDIITAIEKYNRLRIGAVAPEITWKESKVSKKLSTLEEVPNYLLIFWSSTCSHCLRELPKLQEELKGNTQVKVIAVGIEDDDYYWKTESKKLDSFTHVISLGKWQSEYSQLYAIEQTPSYFLLDKDKKITAKPETQEEVVELLKK